MASTHIEIPGASASRISGELRQLIDQLQRTVDHAAKVKMVADTLMAGNDWVALGAAWGVSATDAQTAYGLLVTAQNKLTGAAITDFLGRLG